MAPDQAGRRSTKPHVTALDAEDLVVTRSGHEPLVVMLKSDYDAWRETEYLSHGANGRELRRRAAEMDKGSRVERDLVDTDAEVAG